MFVIHIVYTKPLEEVDRYVEAHREYMDLGFKNNLFVTSGPLIPRTGGMIISHEKDRAKIEEFLAKDPYKVNGVAEYQFYEFNPIKFHEGFRNFL